MTTTTNIRGQIMERMSISMSDGVAIGDAAKIAVEWIIKKDLAVEFVKDLGPRAIAQYWRDRKHEERKNAFDPSIGTRRLDTGQLGDDGAGSPYALMWSVPGVGFIAFGDLTKTYCMAIAEYFDESAKQLALKREFFKVVAGRLSFDKIVENCISEDELWSLMKQHGVREGDEVEPD